MHQGEVAFLNGTIVPASEAKLSPSDRGFFCADAVFDTLRTVNHRPYLLGEHISRLQQSLAYVGIDVAMSAAELAEVASDVAARNLRHVHREDDVWVRIHVTRGVKERGAALSSLKPTVLITTETLDFERLASGYQRGIALITPPFREIPSQCVDPRLKTVSRMHYNLAEQFVARIDSAALPLMLDLDGNVAQGTASNVFLVKDNALFTPPVESALAGISRSVALDIARALGIPVFEERLSLYMLATADEIFTTATSYCVMPVASVNGARIGAKAPGPVTRRLLAAWSARIEHDIVGQAIARASSERVSPAAYSASD